MGTTTLSLEIFEKTLNDIYDNLQQFIITLDEEKQFLQKSKVDELENAILQKRVLAQSLEDISNQCQQLLSSANFPFNDKSMMTIIASFPAFKQAELKAQWQKIKELLKLCDRKNLVNGVMITTLKNYNEHMLHIITQRPKDSVYSNQSKKMYSAAVSTREHKA